MKRRALTGEPSRAVLGQHPDALRNRGKAFDFFLELKKAWDGSKPVKVRYSRSGRFSVSLWHTQALEELEGVYLFIDAREADPVFMYVRPEKLPELAQRSSINAVTLRDLAFVRYCNGQVC